MKTLLRHLSAFTAPIVMCFILPYLIITATRREMVRPVSLLPALQWTAGALVTLAGLTLLVLTIRMFILIGRGTIMPWDPTRKLITASLYAHVRNPMILGVILVELGEAILFSSWLLAGVALAFFAINTVYFMLSEEPGLEKRFGQEYIEYKRNVPRWLPRIKPWRPGG